MKEVLTTLWRVFIEALCSSRMQSLYWRSGSQLFSVFVDVFLNSLAGVDLPAWLVVGFGLVLGEVTKHLNNKAKGK